MMLFQLLFVCVVGNRYGGISGQTLADSETAGAVTCTKPNSIVQNSKDCSQFYMCADGELLGAGFSCPEGFLFDDSKGVCSSANKVDCGSRPRSDIASTTEQVSSAIPIGLTSTTEPSTVQLGTTSFVFPWWQFTASWKKKSTPKIFFASTPDIEQISDTPVANTFSVPTEDSEFTTKKPFSWWDFTSSGKGSKKPGKFNSLLPENDTSDPFGAKPMPWLKFLKSKKPTIPEPAQATVEANEDTTVFPSSYSAVKESESSEESTESLDETKSGVRLKKSTPWQMKSFWRSPFCPPYESGLFPHPFVPHRYFVCWNGRIMMSLRCPGNNSLFDEVTKSCTTESNFPESWSPYNNLG